MKEQYAGNRTHRIPLYWRNDMVASDEMATMGYLLDGYFDFLTNFEGNSIR